jgi:DNA polymerase III delta prime subunit
LIPIRDEDNPVWAEKYRPHRVDDVILPERLKAPFRGHVAAGIVPNMLLYGGPGVGKTTVAMAMLDEIGADYIKINSSLKGNIDTLREEISNFASTVSFFGGRKYVLLDEADGLNQQSTQPALRTFIEEYSGNCGFILTANHRAKIIPALHSRIPGIELRILAGERREMATAVLARTREILTREGVEHDPRVVAEVIKRHMPDWRLVIGELQGMAAAGPITAASLDGGKAGEDHLIGDLVEVIRRRDFTSARKWVGENPDVEAAHLFRRLYELMRDQLEPKSLPGVVIALSKYGYQAAFVADQEINTAAALAEVMVEASFK